MAMNQPTSRLASAVARILAETPSAAASPSLLRAICESLGWDLGILWKVDPDAHVLRWAQAWHDPSIAIEAFVEGSRGMAFPPGVGLPGRVWASGEPVWLADLENDENFPRVSLAVKAGVHAGVGFPIRLGGQVLGVMEFFTADFKAPDEELVHAMAMIGSEIGQLMERLDVETIARTREARYESIVNSALDCVIGMDHDGRVIEFNPAAEGTFGWSRDDVVGRPLADVIIPERLRSAHWRGLARHLESGGGEVIGRRLELSALRSDGTEFPVELTVTRFDGDGPPVFTGFLRDITDRVRADEERRALLAREQHAREMAERAGARLKFLADAGDVLGSSLDYEQTLRDLGRLVVPRIADWYAVDLLDDRGRLTSVAVSHVDPTKVTLAEELRRRYPPDPDSPTGPPNVIRTGKTELYPLIEDATIEAAALDDEHRAVLRSLELRSVIVAPLAARGRIFGAITLVSSDPGRLYDEQDATLAEELAERAGIAIDNARLYRDRDHIARVLQESLLPPMLPSVEGFELAAYYRPSGSGYEVGGDFYDVFQIAAEEWGLLVGDVCGKGPEAAAVTGLARHTIRVAAMTEPTTDGVLGLANREMLRQELGERFCSVALVRVRRDADGARLIISTGGHPLPVVRHADGTLEEIGRHGMLLAVADDADFSEAEARLTSGDTLVLYTDGLIDRDELEFSTGRLASILSSGDGTAEGIVREIERAVDAMTDDERTDDVAVVALGLPRDRPARRGGGVGR
jgi:PAS domain S-box-containing protein